jgi:DNA-binding NtrC family response regulator
MIERDMGEQGIENLKVLIVDDEEGILNALSRTLRGDGYTVWTTTDPLEAVRLLEGTEFAVVISDYRMPRMTGEELMGVVRERYPNSTRVVMSGTDIPRNGLVHHFFSKPFDNTEVKGIVRKGIDEYVRRCEDGKKSPDA